MNSRMVFNNFPKLLTRNFYVLRLRKAHTAIASVQKEAHKVKKKPEKEPFMKNIFLGIVDKDVLIFPEAEESQITPPGEALLQLESKAIIGEESEFLRLVRSGICSLGFPKEYGGIPSNSMNLMRYIEKLNIALPTSVLLETQYSLITGILQKFGSEEQKKEYLKDLMGGAVTGAYAAHEEDAGSDPPSLQCTTTYNDTSYILNGKKTWIANGSNANFYIVLAQHKDVNRASVHGLLSAYIVKRDTPGVTIKKLDTGLPECDLCELRFENVSLPSESLLGNIGSGYDIAVSSLESCKFIFSAAILNLIRKLLSLITVQISCTSRFPSPLREFELVQFRLSRITATLFALESSVYYLAGMKDLYEMDTSLESVIVQNLLCTYGMNAIEECLNIAGIQALDKTKSYQALVDNVPLLFRSFTSSDIFKLYISLKAMEYSGQKLASIVHKVRNPLNYPGFVFRRMLNNRRHESDSPKLDKNLFNEFHPSLKNSADQLEYCICRLQYTLESFLAHNGTESVQRQVNLVRISDIACDIFSMIAVLARASRSYCTGIRYSDQEVLITNAWCQQAMKRVKMNVSGILEGTEFLSDLSFLKLAPDVLQNKGYFFVSPIDKNIH